MRKLIASVLLLTVTVGCTTTKARVAGAPPAPGSADAAQVTGLVLLDGTEVEFQGPAELRSDGSVMGSARVEYTGEIEGARSYRLATYEADQIVAYELEPEKRVDAGKTALWTLVGLGAAYGLFSILVSSGTVCVMFCE